MISDSPEKMNKEKSPEVSTARSQKVMVNDTSLTSSNDLDNYDFDLQGDRENENEEHLGEHLTTDLLQQNKQDLSGADDGISKNESGKIFDQISQRYILNYPQIFERKKKN